MRVILLTLFCFTFLTFKKDFFLILVRNIAFPRVVLSAEHLKYIFVFIVLLHALNNIIFCLFRITVLPCFFFIHILFLFLLLLLFLSCLFAAATEYDCEDSQGASRRSKGQYTLHYLQNYTHTMLIIQSCLIFINFKLILMLHFDSHDIYNLLISCFLSLKIRVLYNNIARHKVLSTHRFRMCRSCRSVIANVTIYICFKHDC